MGDEYTKALNYDKAGALYQYVIANWPDSEYEMWAKSGMVRLDIWLGNDANVKPALDELIADFNDQPALPEAVFVVGEQYYRWASQFRKAGLSAKEKDIIQKAIAVWQRIITDLSSSTITPQAYYMSARCYEKIGQYENAVEYYTIVVDNWPDYEFAWHAQFFVGMYYEKLKNLRELPESEADPKIEQAYKAVVEKYPDSKSVPYSALKLGHLYFKRGQIVEASLYYELFLAMAEPGDPRIDSIESRLEQLKGEDQ